MSWRREIRPERRFTSRAEAEAFFRGLPLLAQPRRPWWRRAWPYGLLAGLFPLFGQEVLGLPFWINLAVSLAVGCLLGVVAQLMGGPLYVPWPMFMRRRRRGLPPG